MTHNLKISAIRLDGGTQPRASIHEPTVNEYAEAYMAGATMPAPVVFFDGSSYWLGDGFHRTHAARQAGLASIDVDLKGGTRRDAIAYALGANATHGLRRTTEDKRRAVRMALSDEEWAKLSNRDLAKLTGTSHPFVAEIRAALAPVQAPPEGSNASSPTQEDDTPRREDNTKGTPAPTPRDDQRPGNASTSVPTEPESADETAPTLAEIADEQQRELERLQADVKALAADDKGAELLKARRMLDNAVRQQGEAMEKAKRAEDREAWTKRQLMRCGAAVGEADPTKVAAAVEAMARKVKVDA